MQNKYLYIIVLLTIILLPRAVYAQGISIGSGTTFTLGNSTLTLPGNWNNSGTFTAGTGTVIMNGSSGNQTITNNAGETFNNLTVNKSSGDVQLVDSITINGTLTLNSGDLNINDKHIIFGSSSSLNESAGNTIKGGTASCTQTLNAPSSQNVIGIELTSASDLGNTTITRGHASQSGNGNSSILRYFDIIPSNNTDLNATLIFYYDESELNGLTESDLILYRSTDGGSSWNTGFGALNTVNNSVLLSGIDAFSRWTLGSGSLTLDNVAPQKPYNLIVTDSSDRTISIEWQGVNDPDIRKWHVYLGTSQDNLSLIDSIMNVLNTTRTYAGLVNGTRYYFAVTAVDYYGNESGFSNLLNAVPTDFDAPGVPRNLAVADSSNQKITLRWNKCAESDFKLYRIYQGLNPAPTIKIDSIESNIDTVKIITGLTNGIRYYFRITVVDIAGNESGYSNEVNAAPVDQIAPSAPVNLAVIDSSNQTILIKWRKNTEADFQKYRIYCGTSPNPDVKIDSVMAGISDTAKILGGLANGIRYYVRITAVDIYGNESGYSNEVNAVPYALVTFEDGSDYIAPDIISNTENNPVGRFKLSAETVGSALIAVKITLSGAFTGVYSVKLWCSADSVFNNDLVLDSVSFFKDSPIILNGDTSAISPIGSHFFITIDAGASSGNIKTTIKTNADFEIAGGMIKTNISDAPLAGNFSVITDVKNNELSVIKEFALAQNYPNPFNPTTNIKYQLPKHSYVVLKVYNLLGQEVKTLVDQHQQQGVYEVKFNAQSLTSGIYIYSLKAGNFSRTKKLILLK